MKTHDRSTTLAAPNYIIGTHKLYTTQVSCTRGLLQKVERMKARRGAPPHTCGKTKLRHTKQKQSKEKKEPWRKNCVKNLARESGWPLTQKITLMSLMRRRQQQPSGRDAIWRTAKNGGAICACVLDGESKQPPNASRASARRSAAVPHACRRRHRPAAGHSAAFPRTCRGRPN